MRKAGKAARLLRHVGAGLLVPLVALELATAGAPLAIIAVIGVLVGRVAADASTAGPLAALAGLLLLQQLIGPIRTTVVFQAIRRIDGVVRGRAMAVANRSLGIAPLEDPPTLERLELAGGTIDPFWDASPGGAAVGVVSLAGRYVQVAGSAWLVARVSVPVAAGLTALVLFAWRQSRRWNRVRLAAVRANASLGRASRYTSGLANTPLAAKEVRLFGMLDWLEQRFRGEWDVVSSNRIRPLRWASVRRSSLIIAMTPAVAWAFVVLARSTPTPRSLAVALQAGVALFPLLFDARTDDAYQVDFGLEALDVLRELEASIQPGAGGDLDAGGLPRKAIRFEAVQFAYPGTGRDVFSGLDLTVTAGTSLAIVGGNGAGKTTLVKLLARLHEPQAGAILVDGTPLTDLDPVAWRRRLAVIFQDFVRYELPASDNVGLGGLALLGDEPTLHTAAARAGALDVISRLPGGWDTPLNRQYTGGADLSGGEWQRVALARALFAVEAGAGILVMDEPTANLDVRAEAALFEDFLDLTRGLTTILISHRFSTVRHADRIVVLEGGRGAPPAGCRSPAVTWPPSAWPWPGPAGATPPPATSCSSWSWPARSTDRWPRCCTSPTARPPRCGSSATCSGWKTMPGRQPPGPHRPSRLPCPRSSATASTSTGCRSATPATTCSTTSPSTCRRAPPSPSWARTAPARPAWSSSCAVSTSRRRGPLPSTASTCGASTWPSGASGSPAGSRTSPASS